MTHSIGNHLVDGSRLSNSPVRKSYIVQQRHAEIQSANMLLLKRMHEIRRRKD
jgi:hypothetical protein